jgi:hypothetical protein
MVKLSFDQLTSLHDELTNKLYHGKIDIMTYVDEWDELMTFSGWSLVEFADEVDRHWTPQKKASSPLFRS